MSAPVVWIIFPAIVASIAFVFRRWQTAVTLIVTLVTLSLAIFALIIPIGEITALGSWPFMITDRLAILGRQFVLDNADRSILIVVYLTLAFFFFGSISAGVSKLFVPFGLAMSAILVASLSVRPFLYAALLIEIAILLGVPLLTSPGKPVERGVLRYLVFMSFGFSFMLLGGWLLPSDITNLPPLLPATVLLGFGFAILLAVFPVNTWIPVLLEQTNPFPAVFVLSVLPTIVIAILLRFTGQYSWLLDFSVIRLLGALMAITGGLWAAFQRDLGRLLGYAIIIEIGNSIMAVSQPQGLPVYRAMYLPRIIAFGVWALSLSLIRLKVDGLSFKSVQGLGRKIPLVALGLLIAHFSLAGFPLLGGFPVLRAHWAQLVQSSYIFSILAMLSSIGLMIGALRSLAVLVMGPDEISLQNIEITWISQLLLLLGILAIITIGIFPHWFYFVIADAVRL